MNRQNKRMVMPSPSRSPMPNIIIILGIRYYFPRTNLIGMYNGKNARIKCTRKDGTRIPYGIKGGGNDSPSEFGEVDIDAACNGVIHVINDVLLY